VNHVIDPVPESTELITRFSTSMQTNNRLYTDDNGFEMLERIYDPNIKLNIPGNYYPTIYQSFITDGSNSFSVSYKDVIMRMYTNLELIGYFRAYAWCLEPTKWSN